MAPFGSEIVTSGRQIPGRDGAIAALFYVCYTQLVATGYGVAGDWAVAEELAQEAFVRLWRRWRWIRDPDAAPAYLHRTVVNSATPPSAVVSWSGGSRLSAAGNLWKRAPRPPWSCGRRSRELRDDRGGSLLTDWV
jgi:hypothetical protein